MAEMAGRSTTMPPGLAINSQKIALVLGVIAFCEGLGIGGVGPRDVPVELLERVIELVDRAAVELPAGHELVARLQQGVEHDHLRGVTRGDGERRRAAFERGDALLQHGLGRAADARVDVAERFEAEQRGGVVDVVEDVGGGLIDRRDARAGRGVGCGAGMDGERGKPGRIVGRTSAISCRADGNAGASTGANGGAQVNGFFSSGIRRSEERRQDGKAEGDRDDDQQDRADGDGDAEQHKDNARRTEDWRRRRWRQPASQARQPVRTVVLPLRVMTIMILLSKRAEVRKGDLAAGTRRWTISIKTSYGRVGDSGP